MDITQFNLANPWRTGTPWNVPEVRREKLEAILNWLEEPEILILAGARQVGKTSIVYQMIDHLLTRDAVLPEDIFFFNLDLAGFADFFEDQGAFLRFLDPKRKRRAFVFVDEVQRLADPGLFFKAIQDLRMPFKFILTGSSSLDIKVKTSEALTGRKKVFRITPFNFTEFLTASGVDLPLHDLDRESAPPYLGLLNDHLHTYAQFGGYPAVVLTPDRHKKIQRMEEIYSSYLEKDIAGFLRIENVAAFRKMATLLADQQGSLVNLQELSSTLGIHRDTAARYMEYMEATFIINRLNPFFTNPRSELSKMPKIYFADSGLRNHALGRLGNEIHDSGAGPVMEGLVLNRLLHQHPYEGKVNYWRTTSKTEVDFVMADVKPELAIEVKSGEMKSLKMTRGFSSFLKKYNPPRAFLLNKNLWEDTQKGETEIEAIPLVVFLARTATEPG